MKFLTSDSNFLGYSESFQSFVLNYNGTGLFGLYFASDPLMSDYMVLSTQNIWKTLSTSVPEADVQRAKNLLKTNLLLQLDSNYTKCLFLI